MTLSVREWKRYMNASISFTPFASAARCISKHSAAVIASGFSQSTCFRASAARTAHSQCMLFGNGMYTASTSGSSRSAS